MASAVAKRSDHRASRSASWSVMHSDEELARILQMQEEKEYQDHLAAKEKQCQSDHKLARFLSENGGHLESGMDIDEFQEPRSRSASNFTGAAAGTSSQNATVISVTDSDPDFSDCLEDTTFDELTSVLERARDEADRLAEQQYAADVLMHNDAIAEAVRNDEQLNRMLENELELSGSSGEVGNASFNPVVVSPSSAANSISICTGSDLSNRGTEPIEFSPVSIDVSNDGDWTSENELAVSPGASPANNSLLMSVNVAWNVVGSAVNWVSEFFSGVQSPPDSNVNTRVTTRTAGDVEEEDDDEEEEEEGCEEDDGWEDDDSDHLGDFDDDDDDDDDEDTAFDLIDSDMDDSDEDNTEQLIGFGDAVVGRGLVQAEIDVLPTRTYQSRPPQTMTTTTMRGAADASANEHQCQNECQVCLSSFADGEVLRTLPCCHQFHSECIDVWLQRNAICPVCRVRIRDEIGCR